MFFCLFVSDLDGMSPLRNLSVFWRAACVWADGLQSSNFSRAETESAEYRWRTDQYSQQQEEGNAEKKFEWAEEGKRNNAEGPQNVSKDIQ